MTSLTLDDALELSPIGYFQYRLLFICGLAFMADAMEVNLLLFLATCAGNEWNLTDQQKAILSGVVFCGIIVGSFFWGLFADRYGRKLAFLLTCIIVSLGGIISGAAPDYISLVTIRAIVGLGIGGANIPFDLLAEFLPASHRGRFLIYIEFFWTIGSILVTAIAWTTLSVHGWRTMTYLTAIPVTLTSILSVV